MKTARACTACYNAKRKCIFSIPDQEKCDRCTRQGRECIPRLSRQGQKTTKHTEGDAVNNRSVWSSANRDKIMGTHRIRAEVNTSSPTDQSVHARSMHKDSKDGSKLYQPVSNVFQDWNHQSSSVKLFHPDSQPSLNPLLSSTTAYANLMAPPANNVPIPLNFHAARNSMSGVDNSFFHALPAAPMAMDSTSVAGPDVAAHRNSYHTAGSFSTNDDAKLMDQRISIRNAKNFPIDDQKLSSKPLSKCSSSNHPLRALSIKQWTKGALESINRINGSGISDTQYLTSALHIALSLSKQICSIENHMEKMNMLALGNCWGDYVTILLKDRADEDDDTNHKLNVSEEWLDEPIPHLDENPPAHGNSTLQEDDDPEVSTRLDAFLNSFQAGDYKAAEIFAQRASNGDFNSTSSRDTNASGDKLLAVKDLNYFSIESAEIRCRKSASATYICRDEVTNKLQQIYYLGLVFYQLFSGGEAPPSSLYSLATFEDAFISLPRLSLAPKNDGDNFRSSKRQQGASNGEMGLCSISFEYLKCMNLPGPICRLVFNMLDCIYGCLSGTESYASITDVTDDLQSMVDKPNKFLKDLDAGALSFQLQLKEFVIPREEQFSSIISCYNHCVSRPEVAILQGDPGSGKSWLAKRAGKYVASAGGIFLYTKFDQMRTIIPSVAVLASTFNQYCDLLIRNKHSDWAKGIISRLLVSLGNDACHLIKTIPKLSEVLDCRISSEDSSFAQDSRNALERWRYSFARFVDVICNPSNPCIVLCIDDMQWSDKASISVLHQILNRQHNRIFFLGCYRSSESNESFWKMIENISANGVNTTAVEMTCLKIDELTVAMSELLCLSPRLVRPLAGLIHKKTKGGNALLVSQFLLSLNRDNLLRIDLSNKRWVWDGNQIATMKLPDNIALCFTNDISKLTPQVQSALHILSMFGASAQSRCLEFLEIQLGLELIEPLKLAESEGLVSYHNNCYVFSHDMIQEATFHLVRAEDRKIDHLTFGRCLIELYKETDDNEILFIAVCQINLGSSSDANLNCEDSVAFASLNLKAAKAAADLSQFESAYTLIYHAIGFLPAHHWQDHYALSLEIYELATKCALISKNLPCLQKLSRQVLDNGRCFGDKIEVYFIIMISLASSFKLNEALELGHSILSQLGEGIQDNPSTEEVTQQIHHTMSIICDMPQVKLLNHFVMTDKNKLSAMRFLARLQSIAYFVKPSLNPYLVVKMVNMTLTFGLCPAAPVGLSWFGLLLVRDGFINLGSRCSLLAKAFLKNEGTRQYAGETLCVSSEIDSFVKPLQATHEMRCQGESAALSSGDIQFATINRLRDVSYYSWDGTKLTIVEEKIANASQFAKHQRQKLYLALLTFMQRKVSILVRGNSTIIIDEHAKGTMLMKAISFDDMYLSFIMKQDDLAQSCLIFLKQNVLIPRLLFLDVIHKFYAGLAFFRLYRETHDLSWADKGRECKKVMRVWASEGVPWNFQQKVQLMEAEEYYCDGNLEAAKDLYTKAIESSRQHKWINEEALCCELAAIFYLETGDMQASLEHFILAHELYETWGAVEKVNRLFRYVNETFGDLLSNRST